jgi:hypothetical protein
MFLFKPLVANLENGEELEEFDVTELHLMSNELVLKGHGHETDFCVENVLDTDGIKVDTKVYLPKRVRPLIAPDACTEARLYPEITEGSCSAKILQVYTALAALSTLCLLLTILVYTLLPELRNLQGKILTSSALSTLLATIALIAAYNYRSESCMLLGFLVLFSQLSMFSWMGVMCWDLARTLRSMRPPTGRSGLRRLLGYSACGWGGPLLFTGFAFACQHALPTDSSFNPQVGQPYCWLDTCNPHRELIFFHLPVLLLLLGNLAGFGYCALHIRRTRAGARRWTGGRGDSH